MKTKIVIGSVLFILILGLAGGAYWWASRPQVITFSDGSKLTLLGVEYGKRHAMPGGRMPPAPATPASRGQIAVRRSFTTPNDALVVWVRAKYDYSPTQNLNFQLAVYDQAGTACAQAYGNVASGNRSGDDILTFQFAAFPRREGKLHLRAQENGSGSQETADGKFIISNPAAKKSFAKWTPEPLPSTKEDGDLSVTLTKLVAGAAMPYQRNQDDPDDAINKGVQVVFHVERAGKRVTNWQPASVETTDATGNRTAMSYAPNGNQVQWNGDEGAFTYQYGLWPGEPAWKLRLELTQNSDFSGDEQWTAQNIPVVLGSQQSFNTMAGMRPAAVLMPNGVVARPANPPGGANPPAAPVPCAEADLGGHHIKVFPAMQFTNVPPNYPMQGGLTIQIQPALMNNGMRIINGPNGTQMTDDGMRLTLAKVTDDQGGEITPMNSGTSTSGMGGANSTSTFRFNLRDIAGVTNLNATIALHKNRFFEFTVKPEKAPAAAAQ
jgi:hypothetical protein